MRNLSVVILLLISGIAFSGSGESDTLQVHFLYGSKPKAKFRKQEKRWFGGILGGHVGIRYNDTSYLSFFYEGKVHIFQNKKKPNGKYAFQPEHEFIHIMDPKLDSVKELIIKIPITRLQRQKFDSICGEYVKRTPYDYAFFGFRCGSSTYDVLSEVGVVKKDRKTRIWKRVFYPKILRRELLRESERRNWVRERRNGTTRRIWERD